ncbi:MAG: hypothetical protein ACXQS8_03380 [Candidatus Helarchaeales archaeon]
MELDDIWEDEDPTIESVIREKLAEREEEGLVQHVDPFTVRVFSRNDKRISALVHLDVKHKRIKFSATLQHDPTILERSIQFVAKNIEPRFSNEEYAQILEDVYLQLKHLIMPEVLKKQGEDDRFEIETIGEDFTNFNLYLYYETMPIEEVSKLFEPYLEETFTRLIQVSNRIGEYITYAVGLFEVRTPIEMKLLQIRKQIFQAQFYHKTSRGRFADTHKQKFLKFKETAEKMFEEFRKEYPKVDTTIMNQLFGLLE